MNIVAMILDLKRVHFFFYQIVNGIKMLLFLIIGKKVILSLGEGKTQELDDATITIEDRG